MSTGDRVGAGQSRALPLNSRLSTAVLWKLAHKKDLPVSVVGDVCYERASPDQRV